MVKSFQFQTQLNERGGSKASFFDDDDDDGWSSMKKLDRIKAMCVLSLVHRLLMVLFFL